MNLAIRGIEANLGPHNADTFHNDLHKDLKADFILANPPFNVSDWGGERLRDDVRWKYGAPPVGQRQLRLGAAHHPPPGAAAAWPASCWPTARCRRNQSGEGEIRQALVEADLVDCMIALPGQLFYTTQIPVCLWFLARNKRRTASSATAAAQTLFIDARKLGALVDRTHRELTDEEIARIAGTYHAWRGEKARAAGRVRRRAGLLQERHAPRRSPATATCSRPAATSGAEDDRGRRRAVRREDEAADGETGGAVRRGAEAGWGDQGEPGVAGV